LRHPKKTPKEEQHKQFFSIKMTNIKATQKNGTQKMGTKTFFPEDMRKSSSQKIGT